jgi:hypothetical protein
MMHGFVHCRRHGNRRLTRLRCWRGCGVMIDIIRHMNRLGVLRFRRGRPGTVRGRRIGGGLRRFAFTRTTITVAATAATTTPATRARPFRTWFGRCVRVEALGVRGRLAIGIRIRIGVGECVRSDFAIVDFRVVDTRGLGFAVDSRRRFGDIAIVRARVGDARAGIVAVATATAATVASA